MIQVPLPPIDAPPLARVVIARGRVPLVAFAPVRDAGRARSAGASTCATPSSPAPSARAARAETGVRHEALREGRRAEAPGLAYGRSTVFFGNAGRGARSGMPVAWTDAETSR